MQVSQLEMGYMMLCAKEPPGLLNNPLALYMKNRNTVKVRYIEGLYIWLVLTRTKKTPFATSKSNMRFGISFAFCLLLPKISYNIEQMNEKG